MSDHNFEVQTIQVDRRGVIPVGPQVSLRRLPLLRRVHYTCGFHMRELPYRPRSGSL